MPPLWSSKQKEAADRSMTSRNQVDRSATKWCPAKTTSMLLRSSAFRVTEWWSSQRRRADSRHHDFEETNRPRRRTYNTSVFSADRSSTSSTCTWTYVSCDVLLPARRRLTCKRRVVCKPNFGSQLWKRNGYICAYFYWPPSPNPVVTISTRVGPGSRLARGVNVCLVLPTCNQFINNFLFVCSFFSLFSSLFRRLGRAFVAGAVVHYSVRGDFFT